MKTMKTNPSSKKEQATLSVTFAKRGSQTANLPAPNTLGERIRSIRKTLALTQTELAKQSGVTQPTIAALEANKSYTSGHTPSIAAALGVNAYWLETGTTQQIIQMPLVDDDEFVIIPVISAPGNCGGRTQELD